MIKHRTPDQAAALLVELHERFSLDPETGRFTYLQKLQGTRIRKGDLAGTINSQGYIYTKVAGATYRNSHLVWLWYTGTWPSATLDHKNWKPSDDRFNNLQAATQYEQIHNRRCSLKVRLANALSPS